jgi:sulfoxide reductase heme-binding subunit YedZ
MDNQKQTVSFWTYLGNLVGFLVSNILGLAVTIALGITLNLPQVRAALDVVLPMNSQTSWHLTRGVATVAYLTITASMAWGLVLSSKIAKDITPAPITLEMHQTLSWLGIGLGAFHAYLLLFDTYYHYVLTDLVVPFTGPYRPVPVGIGIIGAYVLYLVTASFSWKAWMGQKAWRLIHYLSFPAFVLATVHGWLSGTDSVDWSMRVMYIASVGLILFLTNYRIMAGRKVQRETVRQRRPEPARLNQREDVASPFPDELTAEGRPQSAA